MSTLYLLNSPILPGFGRYEFEGPVAPQEARRLVADGFVSAIGHEATARLLTHILGQAVAVNRQRIHMRPGDQALVLRLKQRLPEGRVLSFEEISELPFDLGLLRRLL